MSFDACAKAWRVVHIDTSSIAGVKVQGMGATETGQSGCVVDYQTDVPNQQDSETWIKTCGRHGCSELS